MRKSQCVVLVLALLLVPLLVPLSTLDAQTDDDPLQPCTLEDITPLMDALLPVVDALAAAEDLRPEAKLDWVALSLEEYVALSLMYAHADDLLAVQAAAAPICAESTLLISQYDARLNELTLWGLEMSLFHTYQADPDDVDDAHSFKAHAIFHMEQAEKIAVEIATHTANLSNSELLADIPACTDDELSGDYARFLSGWAMHVPLIMGEIDPVIGPTSSQLLTVDSFNMTLSDVPDRLPYPVPVCRELMLQTIDQYTEMADLAIFGMLTKLAAHMVDLGDSESAMALAAIVDVREDAVMALFAKWGGQVGPESPD